jgi:hypothetical protein
MAIGTRGVFPCVVVVKPGVIVEEPGAVVEELAVGVIGLSNEVCVSVAGCAIVVPIN